jgi:hypothetical protein
MRVSTLIYSVREDWSEQATQIEKDRRRVGRAVILVGAAIGPGVFLADRLAGTVAWRSLLGEALSLCLYGAVAVWYGLRQRSGSARRVALMVYLVGLVIMGLVDLATKRNLSTLLVNSPRANQPILWAGGLMLFFLPLIGWVAWRYPVEMNRVGLGFFYPLGRLGTYILAGLGVGLLIGFHFWLTLRTAGMQLELKPWPYVAWQFFYEVGPQSLTEELFMRGVVFNELYFGRGRSFWVAALATSGLELLSLLVKRDFSASVLIVIGVVFYTVVSSVASAGLFRWSRSVVPGYVHNVVFSVITLLR